MQSTIVPKLMNKRHQLALRQRQTVIKAYKKNEQNKPKTKQRVKIWKQHQILHLQTRLVQLKPGGILFTEKHFPFPSDSSLHGLRLHPFNQDFKAAPGSFKERNSTALPEFVTIALPSTWTICVLNTTWTFYLPCPAQFCCESPSPNKCYTSLPFK